MRRMIGRRADRCYAPRLSVRPVAQDQRHGDRHHETLAHRRAGEPVGRFKQCRHLVAPSDQADDDIDLEDDYGTARASASITSG